MRICHSEQETCHSDALRFSNVCRSVPTTWRNKEFGKPFKKTYKIMTERIAKKLLSKSLGYFLRYIGFVDRFHRGFTTCTSIDTQHWSSSMEPMYIVYLSGAMEIEYIIVISYTDKKRTFTFQNVGKTGGRSFVITAMDSRSFLSHIMTI